MDDITTEQKLQLVQQIRSQYHQNQYDISNRERILYGRTSGRTSSISVDNAYPEKIYYRKAVTTVSNSDKNFASESLKLRCVLAAMLFAFAILFDILGIKPAGMEMQQVYNVIAADYKENVTEFVKTISSETKNSP